MPAHKAAGAGLMDVVLGNEGRLAPPMGKGWLIYWYNQFDYYSSISILILSGSDPYSKLGRSGRLID